jgi:hypothetical protein
MRMRRRIPRRDLLYGLVFAQELNMIMESEGASAFHNLAIS